MTIYPELTYLHALGDGGLRAGTQVVVIHATDNTATALAEASYATHRTDKTSAHFYVDDRAAVQGLDTSHIAYGCLYHGNQISVQLELCGRSNELSDATLRQAAPVVARVCAEFGIPVRKVSADLVAAGARGICGHADITAAFPQDHGDHTDPGASFPWSTFIDYVQGGGTMSGYGFASQAAADATVDRLYALVRMLETTQGGPYGDEPVPVVALLKQVAMDAKAAASLPATVTMTEQDRAAIVAELAAAIPSAAAIADELAKRLGNG